MGPFLDNIVACENTYYTTIKMITIRYHVRDDYLIEIIIISYHDRDGSLLDTMIEMIPY